MKSKNLFNSLQVLGITSVMLVGITVNAQQTTGDVTKQADVDPGTTITGGAVRVIDNKGTIKYLQSQNGITMLSNTTDDVTTTTWQLGGTLIDSTFIDVSTAALGFDGIKLVDTDTESASTDATTQSSHDDAVSGSGFTILVRDEDTGEIKKLTPGDLDILESGQEVFTATDDQTAYALNGSPVLPTFSQVWVYRNGAKLLAGTDYTVAASTVTLVTASYSVYAGDTVEVHFIR